MARRVRYGASVVVCLLLATACGGTPGAVLQTPGTTGSPAPSGPSVSISQPTDGATVQPGDLAVQAQVGGVNLVNKVGSAAVGGEGHLIFYLDVDFIPTEAGKPAYTTAGTYQSTTSTTHTWTGLTEGKHALFVQIVNNDDTPLQPAVTDRAVITVSATAPSSAAGTAPAGATQAPAQGGQGSARGGENLAITSPQDGASMQQGNVRVTTEVTGFKLVNNIGEQPKDGEGHLLYYMGKNYDPPTAKGKPATSGGRGRYKTFAATDTSWEWTQVTPGTYKFAVQLVNNDHTPLDPPQVAQVTVTVG